MKTKRVLKLRRAQTEPAKPRSVKRVVRAHHDGDLAALNRCCHALEGCTSARMLKATLDFLLDRFVMHPVQSLPERLRPNDQAQAHGGKPVPQNERNV